MAATLSDRGLDEQARIVALFSVLVHAWWTGNSVKATEAVNQLESHGIQVNLRRIDEERDL
jgi:hypothetical protein